MYGITWEEKMQESKRRKKKKRRTQLESTEEKTKGTKTNGWGKQQIISRSIIK